MAFVTAQTDVQLVGGGPRGMLLITGTYTNSAGGSGGVIAAGYTNSSGTLTAIPSNPNIVSSIGGRSIIFASFTPDTNDATAPGGVKSFDTTLGADKFTLVTSADSTGKYQLFCYNDGQ